MKVGDKIIVIEHTHTGETFEWDGEIMSITKAYVETKHSRNAITHPQWLSYFRAYNSTWIKHYFDSNGLLENIRIKNGSMAELG